MHDAYTYFFHFYYHIISIPYKSIDSHNNCSTKCLFLFQIAACLSSEYSLVNRELLMPNSASQRSAQLQCKNKLIVEIDSDHSSDLIGTANRLKPVKNWKRDLISKSLANDASIQVSWLTLVRNLGLNNFGMFLNIMNKNFLASGYNLKVEILIIYTFGKVFIGIYNMPEYFFTLYNK